MFYLIGITVLCINGFSSSLLFYTAQNAANAVRGHVLGGCEGWLSSRGPRFDCTCLVSQLTHADPPLEDWEEMETIADVNEFWVSTFLRTWG